MRSTRKNISTSLSRITEIGAERKMQFVDALVMKRKCCRTTREQGEWRGGEGMSVARKECWRKGHKNVQEVTKSGYMGKEYGRKGEDEVRGKVRRAREGVKKEELEDEGRRGQSDVDVTVELV